MALNAPVCNTTVFTPDPRPTSPVGLRPIPHNATLADVIKITNDNLSPTRQQAEFDRLLRNDLAKPTASKTPTTGFRTTGSQVKKAVDDMLSRLLFKETAVVRKKMKVYNPQDRDQWIVDDRVVALVMNDRRTGATWVFQDKKAAKGESAGNEETETSAPGSEE